LNTKEDILKNHGNQTVDWPHTSISIQVNGAHQLLMNTHILPNIFFCVQLNIEIHTDLEQPEDE